MNGGPVLVLFFTSVLGSAALGAPTTSWRHIAWFNGLPRSYQVLQGGKQAVPRMGLDLAPGDCVKIVERLNADPADSINYMLLAIDGREIRVDEKMPSYCVGPKTRVAPSLIAVAHAFESLGELFTRAHYDLFTERTQPVRSRGRTVPPAAIPLLRGGRAVLVGGSRSIEIGWTSGIAPFDVSLYRSGVADALDVRRGVHERRARFAEVHFEPGRYRIEIRDAARRNVAERFAVVPGSSLPRPPPVIRAALAEPSLRGVERVLIEAGWLANAGPAWRLEAYQRATSAAPNSAPARALAFELNGA
jgi:hypothetical protein